jgi:hypothetical protein
MEHTQTRELPMPSNAPHYRWVRRFILSAIVLVSLPSSVSAGGHDTPGNVARETHHAVSVTKNVLTMLPLPRFRLRVADEFTYLGSTSFPLGNRARADVFLFTEGHGDSIERFVKVQIESLVDSAANDYHWEGADTLRVADTEYLRGYWCFDAAELALENPESDTAKTQEWLAANGHRQTGVFVGTRLARIFASGRSELLVFYGETTKLTGIDCSDEGAAMKFLPSVVARSEAATLLKEDP